jgi:hypothetical protein
MEDQQSAKNALNYFHEACSHFIIVQRFILTTFHPLNKFLLGPSHSFLELYVAVKPKSIFSYNWNRLDKSVAFWSDVIKLSKLSAMFSVSVGKNLKSAILYSSSSFDAYFTLSSAFWVQLWAHIVPPNYVPCIVDFSLTCHFTALIAGIHKGYPVYSVEEIHPHYSDISSPAGVCFMF